MLWWVRDLSYDSIGRYYRLQWLSTSSGEWMSCWCPIVSYGQSLIEIVTRVHSYALPMPNTSGSEATSDSWATSDSLFQCTKSHMNAILTLSHIFLLLFVCYRVESGVRVASPVSPTSPCQAFPTERSTSLRVALPYQWYQCHILGLNVCHWEHYNSREQRWRDANSKEQHCTGTEKRAQLAHWR